MSVGWSEMKRVGEILVFISYGLLISLWTTFGMHSLVNLLHNGCCHMQELFYYLCITFVAHCGCPYSQRSSGVPRTRTVLCKCLAC
jgi:hypothetical protein